MRVGIVIFVGILAFGCGHGRTAQAWNQKGAADYLDARTEAWLAWPQATRGEGATETSCLCCHTVVPYAMSRALLGGESNAELVRDVELRVERFASLNKPNLELMYDSSEALRSESVGTEAVLNAVVLAFRDANLGRQVASQSTTDALAALWSVQREDGSWDWLSPQFELEPWESTSARFLGVSLALIAAGTAPGGPSGGESLERARTYLRANFSGQNRHNQLWALWADAKSAAGLKAAEASAAIAAIGTLERPDGGYSLAALGDYRRGDAAAADGYATALVAIALRRHGEDTNRALAWLRENQLASGAWAARSVNRSRDPTTHVGKFMSDAATALAVLALLGD